VRWQMGKKKAGKAAGGGAAGAAAGGGDDLDAILAELDAVQTILCAEEVGPGVAGGRGGGAEGRGQTGRERDACVSGTGA
jgi:hypothetical protein